jgi:hypothetical protein
MVATAAHLTDHVIPRLPVRQWVLAMPKRLRYSLQRDTDLQGAALRLFLRAVEQCLRTRSPGSRTTPSPRCRRRCAGASSTVLSWPFRDHRV